MLFKKIHTWSECRK